MTQLRDMEGQRFGKLTVLQRLLPRSPENNRAKSVCVCACDCGSTHRVLQQSLRSGLTVSCGCYQRAVAGTQSRSHGHASSPTYAIWRGMKARCTNPRNTKFACYGGRGISVCTRWRESFENFLADMGERPAGLTIDRYPNNDGNYEPGNCRWATRREQGEATRATIRVEYCGEVMPLKWAAKRAGLSYSSVKGRIRIGWSIERALSTPIDLRFTRKERGMEPAPA